MIYSTLEFLILFITTFCFFNFFTERNVRYWILLIASILFYAWAGLFDSLIFLFVVILSGLAAKLSDLYPRHRKLFLISGITLMAIHLFTWKYLPWTITVIQKFSPEFYGGQKLHIPLPVGISFFTLQGIAYLVDLWRKEVDLISVKDYVLFKSFFPQLVAGPIVRVPQLLPQLQKMDSPCASDWYPGLGLFLIGFYKKILIADMISPQVDAVFADPLSFNRMALVLSVVGYTIQIWADFSGYTDMGRGAAKMLGITLPQNFAAPYLASSPSDFWKRWHITLSQWIRDYIYIPLGGNRGSTLKVATVTIITMIISGLWHGAAFTFIIWGGYHGVLLCLERFWKRISYPVQLPHSFKVGGMLFLTMLGWLIFRVESLGHLKNYLKAFIKMTGTQDFALSPSFILAMIACATFHFFHTKDVKLPTVRDSAPNGFVYGTCAALIIFTIVFFRNETLARAFIYFQF